MSAVRTSVVVAAACLLAACARSGTTQTGCEESTRTLAEMAGCLKGSVERAYTPRPQYHPELNLYLVKLEQLTERVRVNQLSEFDARVELQRNYLVLMEKKAAM